MAEMAVEKRKTTDHEEIRTWVEQRGGQPASVQGTGEGDAHVLRVDFPGHVDEEPIDHINWNEWFDRFEQHSLAFLYQADVAPEEETAFYKLVER